MSARAELGLRVRSLSKSFGQAPVLSDVSLEVRNGEFVTLLGPSGCGKTTLLNIIAGFFPPDSGCIEIGDEDVTATPAYRRHAAMVFQNYALFPHLDVASNVAFGLKMRTRSGKHELRSKVDAALDMVKMRGMQARFPQQLSGGQQQRVALARALVLEPELLLLDEPLSNLDANLRQDMQIEIRNLQRTLGITTILVTHDQEEAFVVSDRVAMMHKGRIEQIGTPQEIYRAPATHAVASFIGRMNWIAGETAAEGRFHARLGPDHVRPLRLGVEVPAGTAGFMLLRPEKLRLSSTSSGGERELEVKIESRIYLGPVTHYRARIADTILLAYHTGDVTIEGDTAYVSWCETDARFIAAGEVPPFPPSQQQ